MTNSLVILDTSVFISAYLSQNPNSAPNLIIKYWKQQKFKLIITPQILEEIVVVLVRKNIDSDLITSLVANIKKIALFKKGEYETNFFDDIDPKDNIFLAAAYEGKANYLVSTDKRLLNLKYFHETQICNPTIFISLIK